jgi:hypothetical protein
MFDADDRGAMLAALVKQLQSDHDVAMSAGNVSAGVSASKAIADLLALALPKQTDAPPPTVPVKLHMEWGDDGLVAGPPAVRMIEQLAKRADEDEAASGHCARCGGAIDVQALEPSDAGPGDEAEVERTAAQLRA